MRTETFGEGATEITLHLGDMRDIIPEHVAPGSVDAVITDPPYGCTVNAWDVDGVDLEAFWKSVLGVARENTAFCVCGQQPFFTDLINSNRRMFHYELVWRKPRSSNFMHANKQPMRGHENVGVFYRRSPTYHPQKRPGRNVVRASHDKQVRGMRTIRHRADYCDKVVDGFHPSTLLVDIDPADTCHPEHPTQKPLSLMEWLIRTYTNPGELVLDPYFGSGTTAAACVRTGRRFVGCEMVEEYFERACRRIEREFEVRGVVPEGGLRHEPWNPHRQARRVAGGLLGCV